MEKAEKCAMQAFRFIAFCLFSAVDRSIPANHEPVAGCDASHCTLPDRPE
jgi:hypothetical protein